MSKESSYRRKKLSPVKPLDYYPCIIENSRDILYLINAKTGKFEYVSPATVAISGFTAEEITKMGMKGINERTHAADLGTVEHRIVDTLAKGSLPKNYKGYIEARFKHKAGHYVWFGISRNFITDKRGRIKAVVGSIRDITETKFLQQQLESALDNYKTLYNNAQVALYRTRLSDGKLLECNEALAKMLGYAGKKQCIAKHYSTEYYANQKRRRELIELLKEKGQVSNFEVESRRVDGSVLWMKISAQAYPKKGYAEGAICDITATKLLTQTENRILELIMQGKSSKEIAFQTKRSVRTVEDHRAHIMHKLGAHNLIELARKTMAAGGYRENT